MESDPGSLGAEDASGQERPDDPDPGAEAALNPEVEKAVEEAAEELGLEDPSVKDEVAQLVSAQYRGPLPPPAMLAAYDEVVPGLAERMVDWWESESQHRRALERQGTTEAIEADKRGTRYAFFLALVITGAAVFLIYTGHGILGFAALILEVAGLASTFIYTARKE